MSLKAIDPMTMMRSSTPIATMLAVRAYPYNQYVILTSNYWIGQSVRGDVSLPMSMEPLGVNANGEHFR